MKSKFLAVALTALSTITPGLALMSPSLAHANETIVCKLSDNPHFGILIAFNGSAPTLPTAGAGYLQPHETQYPVNVTFVGPNSAHSFHAHLTAETFYTRVGPETTYFVDLGQNEHIDLSKQFRAYGGDEPYKIYFNGDYSTPAKLYSLQCK